MSEIIILPTDELINALGDQLPSNLITQPFTVIFGGVELKYQIKSITSEVDLHSDYTCRGPFRDHFDRHSPPEGIEPHRYLIVELEPCSQEVIGVKK